MANTAVLKPKSRDVSVKTGLSGKYCADMAKSLSAILASTYHLVIKSHIYHWNVVGPLFKPLHELTEEHYNTLFEATDRRRCQVCSVEPRFQPTGGRGHGA